jgi:pimeloyl-ACP methyl ester carboxylesterase
MANKRWLALAGTAAGVAAGVIAERVALKKKRSRDTESDERFGSRRGERSRTIPMPDGAKLFIEEVGPSSKKGVVFIHGSVLRTDTWHYQLPGIGSHRLVFYDLRGHGLSQPKGNAPYTLPTLAADLEAVLDDCGLDEAVIVGHSVGGMAALEFCVAHPEWLGSRVKGIVLVNTTYGPVTETITASAAIARLERLTRRPFDVIGKQHLRIDALRRVIRPTDAVFWGVAVAAFGPGASAAQIDLVYDMLAETPSDVIFDLVKCYRDFDMTERLDEVTVPALVIGGTHDRLTVERASRYLAEHLPKADLKVFDKCGHMAMMERHEEFNELLEGFLNDTLGAPVKSRKRKVT